MERSNLLKKIPKRRSEAESRLACLGEIERVLLDPSARAAYDARLQAGEPSAAEAPPAKRLSNSEPAATPYFKIPHFCTSCGATQSDDASFCEECGAALHDTPVQMGDTTGATEEPVGGRAAGATEIQPRVAVFTSPIPPPGLSPFVFLVPIVLLAVMAAIWFFNRKPSQTAVVPPVSGARQSDGATSASPGVRWSDISILGFRAGESAKDAAAHAAALGMTGTGGCKNRQDGNRIIPEYVDCKFFGGGGESLEASFYKSQLQRLDYDFPPSRYDAVLGKIENSFGTPRTSTDPSFAIDRWGGVTEPFSISLFETADGTSGWLMATFTAEGWAAAQLAEATKAGAEAEKARAEAEAAAAAAQKGAAEEQARTAAQQAEAEKARADAEAAAAAAQKRAAEEQARAAAQRAANEESASVWTDRATGLMWAKDSNSSDVSWYEARNYCAA